MRPSAEIRPFVSAAGAHAFVADGSRVYDIDAATHDALERLLAKPPEALDGDDRDLLDAFGLGAGRSRYIAAEAIAPPRVRALSLNVAQACNMSCGYCYADEGRFGGRARMMPLAVARAAVDRLFAEAEPEAGMVLGFMGGEPLLARDLIHTVAREAHARALRENRRIAFSLTTNATLVTEADARLFHELPFTVTVSLDGRRADHAANRRLNAGGDGYDAVLRALETIERVGRPRELGARATVTARQTRQGTRLRPILDHLVALGFDDAGFSAVLVSPDPTLEFTRADFTAFLAEMIACGEKALAEIRAGRSYPFGNLEAALQEIHAGSHRPYPCGAGAGYLSVNAEGALYACHRLVDDAGFAMGDLAAGPDDAARAAHLDRRHVDRQQPCAGCWARYLCGGGCYHEVDTRGRHACDYIRGWLGFCLKAYAELGGPPPRHPAAPGTRPSRPFPQEALA